MHARWSARMILVTVITTRQQVIIVSRHFGALNKRWQYKSGNVIELFIGNCDIKNTGTYRAPHDVSTLSKHIHELNMQPITIFTGLSLHLAQIVQRVDSISSWK